MRDVIIGLVSPTMALLFAGVFLLLWWSGRIGKHALAFAVSYALLGIGLVTVHFQLLPELVLFHVVQALYSAGSVLLIWGAAQRAGRQQQAGAAAVAEIGLQANGDLAREYHRAGLAERRGISHPAGRLPCVRR